MTIPPSGRCRRTVRLPSFVENGAASPKLVTPIKSPTLEFAIRRLTHAFEFANSGESRKPGYSIYSQWLKFVDAGCALGDGSFARAWPVATDTQKTTRATVFVLSAKEVHFSLCPSVVPNCFVFILSLPSLRTRAAREVRDCNFSSLFQTRRTPTLQSSVKIQAPVSKVDFQFFPAFLRLVLVSGCLTAALRAPPPATTDNSDDSVKRRRFNRGNIRHRFSSPSSTHWNRSNGLTDFSWQLP